MTATPTGKMKDGIVKRGSTWSYVVRERDPETGVSRPRWVGGFRTRQDAKQARDKARAASHDGTYVSPAALTTGEWLDQWLAGHAATLKPTTLASYHAKVDQYLKPHLGAVRLQALSPSKLSKVWADLSASGGQGGKPLSPRTVEFTRAILRKACADAVVERLLTANPVAGSKAPRRERHDLVVWDAEQQARFLAAEPVRAGRWWVVWRLALATGMRRGELCALTWDAVDFAAKTIHVNHSASQIGKEVVTTDPKSGEDRTIAIGADMVAALKAWRKQQASERLKAGDAWADTSASPLVFTWPDGTRVLPDYLSKKFVSQQAGLELDLPRLSIHGTRHTHATTLLRAGVPVHVVAQRLGHADPSLTLRVYSHAIPADGVAAAEVAERVLSGSA